MRKAIAICTALLFGACAIYGVRQADLDAWVGQPASTLEKHPWFLTRPVVRTRASDGTEIWNYVNGSNIGTCSSSGSLYGRMVDYATYSSFSNCMQTVAACNNIFYIKNGIVERYVPVGTGGMRCMTSQELQPNQTGPMNLR
jgi:hypothetical protein